MNTDELKKLLSNPESATLDFKRQIYLVDSENTDAKKRHRDELIKDVLALINGNTFTAGEIAYLVIGASNKKDTTEKRKLFDVTGHNITAQRILNWVNSACEPAVEDIVCEDIDIDGVTLLVITIPPSPHIHETIRELKPKSGKFSKYTVFVRHNEDNRIASAKERETLLQVKSYRFSERKNPPAILFGLFVGGVSGGVLSYSLSKGDIEEYDAPIVGIAGMLTGSFFWFSHWFSL